LVFDFLVFLTLVVLTIIEPLPIPGKVHRASATRSLAAHG
jgi:hypothetical protein